uniref:BHLH domain-containing protein n=1 Tax=Ananas comosus var. bracteatus TaxID=296719 RepID=A0A6V7NLM2_ANACO|nr:unnamed protein product [Ananas comosus var. bracteatus]
MSREEMELTANWSSYNGSSTPAEESEIVAQFISTYPFQNEQDHRDLGFGAPPMYWPDHHNASNSYYCNGNANPNLHYWSQGDSNSSSVSTSTGTCCYFVPHSDYESYYITHPKRKFLSNRNDKVVDQSKFENPIESTKKKSKASTQVQKCAKKMQSKRAQKNVKSGDEEECNAAVNGQISSSCYSSDNESINSQEMNGGGSASSSSKGSPALNLNAKTRAGRGSATDPQSLYARKRRERINERLRILQNLVPNGTKVDISTMLEEAVQYVKFLQLQIKLLSSDELWMYAPIAYNGINIGLDLKISPPQ